MRKYTVLAALTIQAGFVLGLTKAQAAARNHALEPVQVDKKTGDGNFKVLSPVQFKAGEQIATDAELNKVLATQLEPSETAAVKSKEAARAKAEAAALEELRAKAKSWDDATARYFGDGGLFDGFYKPK